MQLQARTVHKSNDTPINRMAVFALGVIIYEGM